MVNYDYRFLFALKDIFGIGDVLARRLLSHFQTAENVFKASIPELMQVDGIGFIQANSIAKHSSDTTYEAEIQQIINHEIETISIQNELYHPLLKECNDAPLYYFTKGEIDFTRTNISIVGTRNVTAHGKQIVEEAVEFLSNFHVNIISGFAYGVDICAHKKALDCGIPTIGVLAHGFGNVYPSSHKKYISDMLKNGGFISEYLFDTLPIREYFLQRNRIIAGLSPVTLVVESAFGGGAITTAKYAFTYNRDVFAVPGRIHDKYSQGCNTLIQQNQAQIYTKPEDLLEFLPNLQNQNSPKKQVKLWLDISEEEKIILELLQKHGSLQIDEMSSLCGKPSFELMNLLLELELKDFVKPLAGKYFELA